MDTSIRPTVFAGKFYPSDPEQLKLLIESIRRSQKNRVELSLAEKQLIGAVVPHAGFIYSGYQAIHPYEIIKASQQEIDTFVIVNPNHSGLGTGDYNLSGASGWSTPLGIVYTDNELVTALDIDVDNRAHQTEHAGEVLLPFLIYMVPPPFRVVLITMNRQTPAAAAQLAITIKNAAKITTRKLFLLASSDFSHFETPTKGYQKDQYVLDEILALDPAGIYRQVKQHHITMCGYGPVMTLVEYARITSPKPQIKLLSRGHSGQVYPSPTVVDYLSLLCYE